MKGIQEKKKVSGCSMEEMKEELSVAEKEDAEEVKKWRGMSQSERDQRWKNLAEKNGRGSPEQVNTTPQMTRFRGAKSVQ